MILLLLLLPNIAWAYIDPQSGGYLFSILASSIYVGWISLVYFWKRIFGKKQKGLFPTKAKNPKTPKPHIDKMI